MKKDLSSDSRARIGTRISAVCDMIGGKRALANSIGVSEPQIYRWIRAENSPGIDQVVAIARAGNVSLEWLATGEGNMKPTESLAVSESPGVYDPEIIFTLVPQYDVDAAAGDGGLVTVESEIGRLAFRRDWVREKGLQPNELAVIRITGDSMAPTIRNHSLLLVDMREETRGGDGIYVLQMGGHLYAKRLQYDLVSGGLYIRSDNPNYDDQHLTADQAESLYIIGRVIWAGGDI